MGRPVTHFEIAAKNSKKLKSFYAKAFGWTFGPGPHKGVHQASTGSKQGIQGFLLERGDHIPDYVSLYVDVENIDKTVAILTKAGGSIIRPTFSPDGVNQLCIVADPEGHVFTLSQLAKVKTTARKKAVRK